MRLLNPKLRCIIYIDRMTDIFNQKCIECGDEDSDYLCRECDEFYCQKCTIRRSQHCECESYASIEKFNLLNE